MAGSSGLLGDKTQESRNGSDLMRRVGQRSCQKVVRSVTYSRRVAYVGLALPLQRSGGSKIVVVGWNSAHANQYSGSMISISSCVPLSLPDVQLP